MNPPPDPAKPSTWARYCLGCYYRLDGLDSRRCPECGRPFDPDDPSTFSREPTKARRLLKEPGRLVALAALVVIGGGGRALLSMTEFIWWDNVFCFLPFAYPLWLIAQVWLVTCLMRPGESFRWLWIPICAATGFLLALPDGCIVPVAIGFGGGAIVALLRLHAEA